MAQEKPLLIYVGDPMCSWCYGFSDEIHEAKDALSDQVDFKLVMGGLRPYNTETMNDLGDFLKHHWEQVHQRSGQPFNYEILADQSFVYDTEPPSRAVIVMRKLNPEKEFLFFKRVQRAFYVDNKNTNNTQTYIDLLDGYEVDKEQFRTEFESADMKESIRSDFQLSGAMGVRGFPAVLLKKDGEMTVISNGYATSEAIQAAVKKQLAQQ